MRRSVTHIAWATAALVSALLLLLPGGTQARYYKTSSITTGSTVSATYAMTNGSGTTSGTSATTVVVDSSTGFGYSAVDLALKNTGNDTRNTMGVTVDTVSSASGASGTPAADATTFAGRLSIIWVTVPAGTSSCSSVSYTSNVVWSTSTTLSAGTGTPAVGGATAQTLANAASKSLCVRYQLGAGTNVWGATLSVAYTFRGWNSTLASFLSNAVTWTQTVQFKVPTPTAGSPTCTYSWPNVTLNWVWSLSPNPASFAVSGTSSATAAATARSITITLPQNALGGVNAGSYPYQLTAIGDGVASAPLTYSVNFNGLAIFQNCTVS